MFLQMKYMVTLDLQKKEQKKIIRTDLVHLTLLQKLVQIYLLNRTLKLMNFRQLYLIALTTMVQDNFLKN